MPLTSTTGIPSARSSSRKASDGFLEELRAEGVPVVLVSGTVDVAEYEGRATAVIPKPFDPADLVAAAHRHAAS